MAKRKEDAFIASNEQLLETMTRLLVRCRNVLSPSVAQVSLVEDITSVLDMVAATKAAEEKRKATNGVRKHA